MGIRGIEHLSNTGTSELETLRARLRATQAVLRYREQELLELKGPCSSETCPLHYAHHGPCETKES